MEHITATVENIVYYNEENGYVVFDFDNAGEMETATGQLPPISEGERLEMSGVWTTHAAYGRQFSVKEIKKIAPDSKIGLIRYLASGIIKGIGPATARRIVESFGMDAMDVIRYNPERLKEIEGIGAAKANAIAQNYNEQFELQEKMSYLLQYDISVNLAHKILKFYKNDAQRIIETNPYLLANDIEGVGFLTADKIANQVGITHNSSERIKAGIKHILNEAASQDGHLCLPIEQLFERSVSLLDEERKLIEQTAAKMAMLMDVVAVERNGVKYVYLHAFYKAECEVAKRLKEVADADLKFYDYDIDEAVRQAAAFSGIELSGEQLEAVKHAMAQGSMVITGGPGTGKTTTINCLINALIHAGVEVKLAAPTGRAAKRMTEATGHDAQTLHRLLEYGYSGDGDLLTFSRDEENPLKCGAVIVDEMSMVDIFLMQHLLRAIKPGTRLIMVGDADQLPSVGPGNVLHDIISSGAIEVARLKTIFRQARESRIIMNAHMINRGERPLLDNDSKDFFFTSKRGADSALQTVIDTAGHRIPRYLKCDPLDIQILSPVKKGLLGVNNLNEKLQEAFNPPGKNKRQIIVNNTTFRVGDKVMQTKNNYTLEWKKRERGAADIGGEGVFNGDIGFITAMSVDGDITTITFDDGKICEYTKENMGELMLAYAVTIHKSQGCEFDAVILPLLSVPPVFISRNILYTAVTRAKKMVLIVGDKGMVYRMAQSKSAQIRYTGLADELNEI